jgi:hypothetical protein
VSKDIDVQDDWEDVNQRPGLPCINQWRNASPREWKKMFAMFEEASIFIT